MEIIKVAMLGIIGVMIATQLKAQKPGLGSAVALSVGLLIFTLSIDKLTIVMEMIRTLTENLKEGETYLVILLKIVGITYVCEFSSGICKDAGHQTIANQIQIFGKLFILFSGMPILISLLNTIKNLGG